MTGRALLVVCFAVQAHAWTPLRDAAGTELAWSEDAWPLALAEAGPAWSRAAAAWTGVADVGFEVRDAPAALGVDGVVALEQVQDPDRWRALVGDVTLVGFTLVTSEAGVLRDADVALNSARFRFEEDPGDGRSHVLETVLGHELGHVLGLGHSCGEGGAPGCFGLEVDDARFGALMFPSIGPGERRGPGVDDIAGLTARIDYPLGVRRPEVGEARSLGPERWHLPLDGAYQVRVRDRSGTLAEVRRQAVDGGVELTTSSPGPLTVEVWSEGGQGEVRVGALFQPVDVDGGAQPALDAGLDADDRPVKSGGGGEREGCVQASGCHMLWWFLVLFRRRG